MKQREIKFRAWHKTQKRMFEVYGLGSDFVTENTLDGVSPGDNCWQGDELKDIEIMQFTGIKDKNGREIYENMILNKTFVIKYLKYRYVLFYISNMSKFEEIFNYENEFEITGEYSEI